MINADKPQRWKRDVAESVDMFNRWFVQFAPQAYRDARKRTTADVRSALRRTNNLTAVTLAVLEQAPGILPVLRMATCPPIARDRLCGLAGVQKTLVFAMENENRLPPRADRDALGLQLTRIVNTITHLLDTEIFPWLADGSTPTEEARYRASTIVADRLCAAVSNPIVRNAQEQRQLRRICRYLRERGYAELATAKRGDFPSLPPGTYSIRENVKIKNRNGTIVRIPIDVVIQPKKAKQGEIPILLEAKSAGDFTNTNKRRKEEATKIHQLRETFGANVRFLLFLCGYFDSGYLGYEAAEGIDWVWEHRIEDLDELL